MPEIQQTQGSNGQAQTQPVQRTNDPVADALGKMGYSKQGTAAAEEAKASQNGAGQAQQTGETTQQAAQAAAGDNKTSSTQNNSQTAQATQAAGEQAAEGQQQQAAEPSIDIDSKFLSERLGGRFKKTEELTAALTEYDGLKKASKEPKFANEFIANFDAAVRLGVDPQKYLQAQSIDFKATPPLERIAFSLEMKYPSLTREEALHRAQSQHKLALIADGTEAENGTTVEDVREARISMKIALADADSHLKQFVKEATTPPAQAQQIKAEERAAVFAPEIPKIAGSFAKMDFTNEGVTTSFKVSDATLREAEKEIKDWVSDSSMPWDLNDPADVEDIRTQVRNFVVAKELPNILRQVALDVINDMKLKAVAEKGNASGGARQEQAPIDPNTVKKSSDQVIFERILASAGRSQQ